MSDSKGYATLETIPGKWIVPGTDLENAQAEYLGKQFKVRYSTDHEIIVQVDRVRLYGGTVRTFCSLVKTVKRWRNPKMEEFSKDGEYIHAGRLERL